MGPSLQVGGGDTWAVAPAAALGASCVSSVSDISHQGGRDCVVLGGAVLADFGGIGYGVGQASIGDRAVDPSPCQLTLRSTGRASTRLLSLARRWRRASYLKR
jgi:hypothetical protein